MPYSSHQCSPAGPISALQSSGSNKVPASLAIDSTSWITSNFSTLAMNPDSNYKINYAIAGELKGIEVFTPVVSDMDSSLISEHEFLPLSSTPESTASLETLPATASNISKELSRFTRFSSLPLELRLKIWHHATNLSRFIEIEWMSNMCLPTSNSSAARPYRVSPHSRRPPVLLHVNRESRRESLTIYTLRTFGPTHPIYFNPLSDILLFGERSCISTVHDVFKTHRHPILNVAITINGFTDGCCDLDFVHAENESITLQTLYGTKTAAGRTNGCVELRDVYFVVNSVLGRDSTREPYDQVSLRPATSDGLTFAQVYFKEELKKAIQGVEHGEGIELIGGDIWTGDDLPKFHFTSFAPPRVGGKIHDGMTAYCKWGEDVAAVCNEAAVKDIQHKTDCAIEVAPVYDLLGTYSGVSEIGIYGVAEKVEKAKELIRAECLRSGWAFPMSRQDWA